MKIAGLVLVVIGFAAWAMQLCLVRSGDVAAAIQESLLLPLIHMVLIGGATLLMIHLLYRFVRSVFYH